MSFYSMDEKNLKAERGLRIVVDFFATPKFSDVRVAFGPRSLGELLARVGPVEAKGLRVTRTAPRMWDVATRSDVAAPAYEERYDPATFMRSWLERACGDDQSIASRAVECLDFELACSEELQDRRRRETLRYLVDSARGAGVLE